MKRNRARRLALSACLVGALAASGGATAATAPAHHEPTASLVSIEVGGKPGWPRTSWSSTCP